jgi:hypothetical protein
MARFTTVVFTTSSVSPGGSLNYDLTILLDTIDIGLIKIIPSIHAGTDQVIIYKKAARGSSDIIWSTKAFTGASSIDPVDSTGAEINEGWIIPYYDEDNTKCLHFTFKNNHSAAKTYTVTIKYEVMPTDVAAVPGSPEGLVGRAVANGLRLLNIVTASRYNATIDLGEFRAKYYASGATAYADLSLVSEGGTFIPDGVTNLQIENITADSGGANYTFLSAGPGRWYFAWRLHNPVGWSRWTDGNLVPNHVLQYVDTESSATADIGPPADWEVTLEDGPSIGTVMVRATRPRTNGGTILYWSVQIKDASTGSWVAVDTASAPGTVTYDGSAIAHTISADGVTVGKVSGTYGVAQTDDLVLIDVRGGDFAIAHCQWALVKAVSGTTLTLQPFWMGNVFTVNGQPFVLPSSSVRPQQFTDLRIKIVRPPWTWTTNGYLGGSAYANRGWWNVGENNRHNVWYPGGGVFNSPQIYDKSTLEFLSDPIAVPVSITNPEARVFFENTYSRSDNNATHSTGKTGGVGIIQAPRTFTNMGDTKYWIPVHPQSDWGQITFPLHGGLTSRMCVMEAVGTYQQGYNSAMGVKARFRLYPDATGLLTVRVTFENVTIYPLSTGDRLAIGLFFSGPSAGWNYPVMGAALTAIGGDSHVPPWMCVNGVWLQHRANEAGFAIIQYPNAIGYNNVIAPDFGENITVKASWYFHNAVSSMPSFAMSEVDVQGVVFGTPGKTMPVFPVWARDGFSAQVGGLELFVGIVATCVQQYTLAWLTKVEIINGLAEVY